jgi:hypothetical protein
VNGVGGGRGGGDKVDGDKLRLYRSGSSLVSRSGEVSRQRAANHLQRAGKPNPTVVDNVAGSITEDGTMRERSFLGVQLYAPFHASR